MIPALALARCRAKCSPQITHWALEATLGGRLCQHFPLDVGDLETWGGDRTV